MSNIINAAKAIYSDIYCVLGYRNALENRKMIFYSYYIPLIQTGFMTDGQELKLMLR